MIGKALQEKEIPYFCDSDLATPFENAVKFQSLESVYEILKECINSEQFFISYEDLKTLINFPSTLANNALDKLFGKTKFTKDLDSKDDLYGEINLDSHAHKSLWSKFMGRFGHQSDIIWIKSPDKILDFEVIKKDYLKSETQDPKKIEILTTIIKLGTEQLRELLDYLKTTPNTEVFRSEVNLIIDHMWE